MIHMHLKFVYFWRPSYCEKRIIVSRDWKSAQLYTELRDRLLDPLYHEMLVNVTFLFEHQALLEMDN